MDIHKPKPAHSWGEFAREMGAVVLGILIALGLEQSVERLRIQREVTEAREALHREMEHDLRVSTSWSRGHNCWIDAADRAKAWADGKGERPRYSPGLMWNHRSIVWDTAKTGAVTHMPLDERLALAKFYEQVATETGVILIHRSIVTEIGGYLEQDSLTREEAGNLARLAGRLRWMANVEQFNDRDILESGAQLHLSPEGPNLADDAKFAAFCRAVAPQAGGGEHRP